MNCLTAIAVAGLVDFLDGPAVGPVRAQTVHHVAELQNLDALGAEAVIGTVSTQPSPISKCHIPFFTFLAAE